MLRTIKLYGRLKKKFGPAFKLEADSPADMIRALLIMVPGFDQELLKGSYRFFRGSVKQGFVLDESLLTLGLGQTRELHLFPVAQNAKSGMGKVLMGAALIGVAVATGGASIGASAGLGSSIFGSGIVFTGVMGFVAKIGIVMALSGLSAALTPKTKMHSATAQDKNESFLFSGAQNTATQGGCVPLIYGRIRAGSVVASSAIDVEQIAYVDNSTSLYTPGIMNNVFGEDLYAIKLQKGGKGAASSSAGQEDPNTLQSNSTARVLDLISEGPIGGLVDGLKSVYFDDVPIQNADDTFNFKGVKLDERKGNPSDDPIDGFSEVESESGVGVKVTTSIPLVRSIIDENADAFRLTVQVPSLYSIDGASGAIKGTVVSYAVDVQPQGGTYTEVLNAAIDGKTNTTYQRAHRLSLPGTGPWNMRLRRLTGDSTESKLQNDLFWSSFTTIIESKLIYPNSAMLGVTVDARQFGSNVPNRSYDVYGRILKVPTNYDPVTRSYATSGPGTTGGVWDGTFKDAWSDNAAWVLHDILTHERYGLGRYIDVTLPNKWMLYEIAQYCDGMVPNGLGGLEPRYTINTQITERGEAWSLIASIVSVFRGMMYWGPGSIEFSYDHDESPSKIVNPANVHNGKFNYSSDNYRTRHSVAIVSYNDPDQGFRPNFEMVHDEALIDKYGYRTIEVSAWGCTSRGQANRVGRWILDTEKYGELVNYTAGIDHSDLRPGQIVEINDPEYTAIRMGGRVAAGSTTTVIALDSPVILEAGKTYSLRTVLPNGDVVSKNVTNGAGSTSALTLSSALVQVPVDGAIWSLASNTLTPRRFRVLAVEEAGTLEYRITAMWHDPNKIARVEQNIDLPPAAYADLVPTGPLLAPEDVRMIEFFYKEGDATMPGALISWTPPKDPRVTYYQWQVKRPGAEGWSDFSDTTRLSGELRNIVPGIYDMRVRSATYTGNKSGWTLREGVELDAGTNPFDNVSGLVVVRNDASSTTVLRWNQIADIRPVTYDVLFYAANDFGQAGVVQNMAGTEFVVARAGYYWVRPVFGDVVGDATVVQVRDQDLSSSSSSSFATYLTNESHTVTTDASGNNGSFATANGQFRVIYNGADVTAACSFSIPSGGAVNCTGTINTSDGTPVAGQPNGYYQVTAMTADDAVLKLRASYLGVNIEQVFNLSKSKAGAPGTPGATARTITLVSDRQTITYSAGGVLDPSGQTISFSVNRQNTTSPITWFVSRLDGTVLDPGTYLSATTGDQVTMTAAQFDAARATNNGVTVRAFDAANNLADRISVVRVPAGTKGDKGDAGAPGNSTYVWIAYADSPDGTFNFTNGAPGDRAYIGIASNRPSATESTSPADYQWTRYTGPTAFGLVAGGNVNVSGPKITTTANTAWDAGAYSSESWRGGASVTFHPGQGGSEVMAGLNTDPTYDNNYASLDYAWFMRGDGQLAIYENGQDKTGAVGPYAAGTRLSIHYDNAFVRYYSAGTLIREVAAPAGLSFWFDSSFAGGPGATLYVDDFSAAGSKGNKGDKGDTGLPGADKFTWIAFADSITGAVNFTTGAPEGRAFIGIAANQLTATESANPAQYQWNPYTGPANFGLAGTNVNIAVNKVTKTGGSTGHAWDAQAYSTESYFGGAQVSFKVDSIPSSEIFVGLNSDPTTNASYESIDYAWFVSANGGAEVRNNGTVVAGPWTYNAAQVFQITYDGVTVKFIQGGVLRAELPQTYTGPYWLDSSLALPGSVFNILSWGSAGAKGAKGDAGVPGGDRFTWIAYADSANGAVNFTNEAPGDRKFIGIAANKTTATESTNPADYTWSQYTGPVGFGLVNHAYMNIAGSKITKIGGGFNWNAGAYSSEAWIGGAQTTFRMDSQAYAMAGLNTDPASQAAYLDIDYAFYVREDRYVDIFSNGNGITNVLVPGTSNRWIHAPTDRFTVHYDGRNVRMLINGQQVWVFSNVGSSLKLYFDCSIVPEGKSIYVEDFSAAGTYGTDGNNGSPGANGKTFTIISDQQSVVVNNDGSLASPNKVINLTAVKANTSAIVSWGVYLPDGRGPYTGHLNASTGDAVTISTQSVTDLCNTYGTDGIFILGQLTDGILFSDKVGISRAKNGVNGTNGTNGSNGANAPQLLIQYSRDNSSWHYGYQEGDAYLRTSSDNGVNWGAGLKIFGGERAFAWRRSPTQPPAPFNSSPGAYTHAPNDGPNRNPPTDWSTTPPGGTDPLWFTFAVIVNGLNLTGWNEAVRADGQVGQTGQTGRPGDRGSDGTNGFNGAPGTDGVGSANRVKFSRFEAGTRGWAVRFNPDGVAHDLRTGDNGRRYLFIDFYGPGADTTLSLGTDIASGSYNFPVTPGERLFASVGIDCPQGNIRGKALRVWYHDASGNGVGYSDINQGGGTVGFNTKLSGFVSVPNDGRIVKGSLEVYLLLAAGPNGYFDITEPFVSQAAPSQTLIPTFSAGPNADDGATSGSGGALTVSLTGLGVFGGGTTLMEAGVGSSVSASVSGIVQNGGSGSANIRVEVQYAVAGTGSWNVAASAQSGIFPSGEGLQADATGSIPGPGAKTAYDIRYVVSRPNGTAPIALSNSFGKVG